MKYEKQFKNPWWDPRNPYSFPFFLTQEFPDKVIGPYEFYMREFDCVVYDKENHVIVTQCGTIDGAKRHLGV